MQSIRELIATGKKHFDNKEYHLAESCLKRAMEAGGRYPDVLNIMGVISHTEGRFGNAMDYLKEAIEQNPNYTEAILNLAVVYNDMGHYDKARKLYAELGGGHGKKGENIEPVLSGKLSNLHSDVGDIYRSVGLYGHAIDEYKKALNLNPDYMDIRTKLGIALREAGQLTESLAEFKKIIRSKPEFTPAGVQMGVTYYAMGKFPDAAKCWKDTLKKEPENAYAKMYLKLCDNSKTVKGKKKSKK